MMNGNLVRRMLAALCVSATCLAFGCGGSGGGKSGGNNDNSNTSSGCQQDADCNGGEVCQLSQALETAQQALCEAGETEVCVDDFGDPCVPEGEDDPFCPICECIPDDTGNNSDPPANNTNPPANNTNPPANNSNPPANNSSGNNSSAPAQGRCVSVSSNNDSNMTGNNQSNMTGNNQSNMTSNNESNMTSNNMPTNNTSNMMCDDDPLTASGVFRGDDDFASCNDTTPTNCRSTYWIVSDAGCFCTWPCSDLGVSPGDACDTNGTIICSETPNDGNWCLHPDMGVCTL